MSRIKYKIMWTILLITTIVFGQKQTKNINESFKVNPDVLVEIETRHSDVTVKTWSKNIVSVEGVWEVEGMTEEASKKYFKNWELEALGNKNKVVITSKSNNNYYVHSDIFDDFNLEFEMAPHIVGMVMSDLPSMPPLPVMTPMPPLPPMPPIEVPVIEHLKELEFDYEAYQNDKEGYMKAFELRQKEWEKEFEEEFEPKMKEYEKTVKEWEKKMGPQMEAYEEKMKEWEKEVAPKMEEWENKMEKKMEKMEKEMEIKFANKMKDKEAQNSKTYKIKKRILINVPKKATLKVDARYGKIDLPNDIKIIK